MKLTKGLLCILLGALTACGDTEGESEPKEPVSALHSSFEGSLVEGVQALHAAPDEDKASCELSLKEKQLILATVVDSKKDEIEKATAAYYAGQSTHFHAVRVGPTYFNEANKPGVPPAITSWDTYYESWEEIYQSYLEIKDNPKPTDWMSLNMSVRSIVGMDTDRILDSWSYPFDKDSKGKLEKLIAGLEACLADKENCSSPSLETSLYDWAKELINLKTSFKTLSSTENKEEKITAMNKLLVSAKAYLQGRSFHKERTVERKSQSEFILPLNPGLFANATAEFAKYVEDIWKNEQFSVKIKWTDPEIFRDAYKILFKPDLGERAAVSRIERVMFLYPYTRTKTLAHEVGHILGFNDHYYTTWMPKECRYKNQGNARDLMSQSQTGIVLPEEWEELDKAYPYKAAN